MAGRPPNSAKIVNEPNVETYAVEDLTVTDVVTLESVLAENAALKAKLAQDEKRYTDLEKRINETESRVASTASPTVTLYCGIDFADGISFTINYERDKQIVFDKIFQSKTISAEVFEAFASSRIGSEYIRKNYVLVSKIPNHMRDEWDIKYNGNELLNKQLYSRILDMPQNELISMYKDLCQTHQLVIARRFIQGYELNDERVSKDKISALNNVDNNGYFKPTLRVMTEREAAKL